MDNWLANQARTKLWQNPEADGQLITKPVRVTNNAGSRHSVFVGNYQIKLPGNNWFHVYQIGSVHPNYGSLSLVPGRWVRAITVMNTYRTNILVYGMSGKTMPLHHTYMTRLDNGMIVIALPIIDIYNWIEEEDVFLRLYAGNEVKTSANPDPLPTVRCDYHLVESEQSVVNILLALEEAKKEGHVQVYIKGKPYFNPTRENFGKWDDVEFHIDGRVRKYAMFQVGDLKTFKSELDACKKYLLHVGGNERYDFADDVEIFVEHGGSGYYYHQNFSKSIRQLTHGDLSIPTARIHELFTHWDSSLDSDDFIIHVVIRNDGMAKPLPYTSDRVHELYKLSDSQIINALVGANSTVPEWRAANLEQSSVNRLAYARYDDIDRALATEAFGYNASSYYAAETPNRVFVDAGDKRVKLPVLLAHNSTVYEYDHTGRLVGAYWHNGQQDYIVRSPNCEMVEAIVGRGSTELSIDYDSEDGALDTRHSYAFYLRTIKDDGPTDEFVPAVDGKDYTIDNTGRLRWTIDKDRRAGVVFDNSKHYFKSMSVDSNGGLFRIGVTDIVEGATSFDERIINVGYDDRGGSGTYDISLGYHRDSGWADGGYIDDNKFPVLGTHVTLNEFSIIRSGYTTYDMRIYFDGPNDITEAVDVEIGLGGKKLYGTLERGERAERLVVTITDSSKLHLPELAAYLETNKDKSITMTIEFAGVMTDELPQRIPMETVECWLNGYPLVYGVDFLVKWPTVVVGAKRYVREGSNNLSIRARGITSKFREPDYGFVIDGLLSNNNMFDVKDDKVVRIVAGGKLLHRDDIKFRDDTGVGVDVVADGMPYSIDDPTVPLRDIIETRLLPERDKSRDLDERVEDYMSVYLPKPPESDVVDLPHYYHVFSPVLNSVIYDLLNNRINISVDEETGRITDAEIDRIMMGYKPLLDFDLAFVGHDNRFVMVHPHSSYETLALTELQFSVVERINHRFLNSAVALNKYLTIGE